MIRSIIFFLLVFFIFFKSYDLRADNNFNYTYINVYGICKEKKRKIEIIGQSQVFKYCLYENNINYDEIQSNVKLIMQNNCDGNVEVKNISLIGPFYNLSDANISRLNSCLNSGKSIYCLSYKIYDIEKKCF